MKIHFLEESLRKSGPGFNEAALKENTDLKVDKVTIQKELRQCRKNLSLAERDVETFKRHVEDLQEKAKRKHADETLRQQLEDLKGDLAARQSEIEELRQRLQNAEGDGEELEKLRGDIEDLEADLREKDRIIEERDDEIDKLKEQSRKDSDEFNELHAELEASRKRVEELEQEQGDSAQQVAKLREAQEELQSALEAKQKAEEDLDEVRMPQQRPENPKLKVGDSCAMKCLTSLSTPRDSADNLKTRQTSFRMISPRFATGIPSWKAVLMTRRGKQIDYRNGFERLNKTPTCKIND